MASGKRLTKTNVEAIETSSTIWDADVRGFGARRQRRDTVYILKYRASGKQRLFTIGLHGSPWTVETARREAKRILGEVAKGTDPAVLRDKMNGAPTFAAFAERYFVEVSDAHKKPTTAREDRRMCKRYIAPRIGHRKVAEIDRGDVARLHSELKDTPIAANRVLALLSHMLNYAMQRGERADGPNPCRKVKRYPENRRERFLSTDELTHIGAAIHEAETTGIPWVVDPTKKTKHVPKENRRTVITPHAAAALRLLLFTGARLGEILTLKWEHVDFERGLLLLPESKTGRKTIVLNAPALAILSGLPRVGSYVIAGPTADKPRADLRRLWTTIQWRAGLRGVRIHDLRHTFASVGAGASLGLPIVGKLLGHAQPATTARYAHLAADPLRQASDMIGRRIEAAMSGAKAAEVVPLPTANVA